MQCQGVKTIDKSSFFSPPFTNLFLPYIKDVSTFSYFLFSPKVVIVRVKPSTAGGSQALCCWSIMLCKLQIPLISQTQTLKMPWLHPSPPSGLPSFRPPLFFYSQITLLFKDGEKEERGGAITVLSSSRSFSLFLFPFQMFSGVQLFFHPYVVLKQRNMITHHLHESVTSSFLVFWMPTTLLQSVAMTDVSILNMQ